ncbi:MAG: hypothetical protein AAFY28_15715 [Actinomycetota bacterium]
MDIDPEEAARRALESNVAISAVNSLGEVLVGESLSRAFRKLDRLDAMLQTLQGARQTRWRTFAVRHPITAIRAVRLLRLGRADGEADSAGSDVESERFIDDVRKDLVDTFARTAAVEGLTSLLDTELLRPSYIEREPWVRLSLPPVGLTRVGHVDEFVADVTALIHRSGEVVVTFVVLLESGEAEIDLVNRWASGRMNDVVGSSMDHRLLTLFRDAEYPGLEVRDPDESDDRPTVTFTEEDARTSIGGVFNVYRAALVSALTGTGIDDAFGEYMMTPLIAVRGLTAGSRSVVGRALAAHLSTDSLSEHAHLLELARVGGPSSLFAGHVYSSLACVVFVASREFVDDLNAAADAGEEIGGQDWAYPELAVGIAVDLALIRLRLVDSARIRLAQAVDSESVTDALSLALGSYSELSGERIFSSAELEQIEQSFLSAHGFEEQLDSLQRQVSLATEVARSTDQRRSRKSSALTQAAIVVLTIIVGAFTPLAVLAGLDASDEEILGVPADDWREVSRTALVLIPIAIAVVALAALFLFGVRVAIRRLRRPTPLARTPRPSRRAADRLPGGLRFERLGAEGATFDFDPLLDSTATASRVEAGAPSELNR